MDKRQGWGVIRYAAGSGIVPEDDCAAFDGWYMDRTDALAVYLDNVTRTGLWGWWRRTRFSQSAWEGAIPRDLSRPVCPLKVRRAGVTEKGEQS
jgi:hypothetical protein